jgi:hypothetical protein
MGGITNHVQNLLLDRLSLVIPAGPVVARAAAMIGQVDILWIEQILHVRLHDPIDDSASASELLILMVQVPASTMLASCLI